MILLELNRENELKFLKIKEWELIRRGMQHDLDKFEDNVANKYVELFKYKNDNLLFTEEYTRKIRKFVDKFHRKNQRHHIEFHLEKNKIFSDLDICEMACDALSSANKNGLKPEDSLKFYRSQKDTYYSCFKNYDHKYLFIFNLLRLLSLKINSFLKNIKL